MWKIIEKSGRIEGRAASYLSVKECLQADEFTLKMFPTVEFFF